MRCSDPLSPRPAPDPFRDGDRSDESGSLPSSLRQKRQQLKHDLSLFTKIGTMICTLKHSYEAFTMEQVQKTMQQIRIQISEVEEELRTSEAYQLDIIVPDHGSAKMLHHGFTLASPEIRFSWVKSFSQAKLVAAERECPGWSMADSEMSDPSMHEWPLLLHVLPVLLTRDNMTIEHGVHCPVQSSQEGLSDFSPPFSWLCSNRGSHSSQISIISSLHLTPLVIESFQVAPTRVLCMLCVPGHDATTVPKRSGLSKLHKNTTVWMGTLDKRLLVFSASMDSSRKPVLRLDCPDSVLSLEFYNDVVFAGLADGSLMFFQKDGDFWSQSACQRVVLGKSPINCLNLVGRTIWCAVGGNIHLFDPVSHRPLDMVTVGEEHDKDSPFIQHMCAVGVGVWLSFRNRPVIRLLHAETRQLVQEVDVSSAVRRRKNDLTFNDTCNQLSVTTLNTSPGKLWVGTSCGIILQLPVPRLGGVPQVMGSVSVSHHGHTGPVRCLVPVMSVSQVKKHVGKTLRFSTAEPAEQQEDEHIYSAEPTIDDPIYSEVVASSPPEADEEVPEQPKDNVLVQQLMLSTGKGYVFLGKQDSPHQKDQSPDEGHALIWQLF